MKTNIDTIREALIDVRDEINSRFEDCHMNTLADRCDEALTALSTIDPDAIRMNCACRAGLYIESVHELDGYHIDPDMLELAILGKEAENV